MKVDVQEIGACKRRLDVEETPEVVREAWERAFVQVQKEARLPGFRKGKVPRSMIKLHFGDDVRQEVARRLIPEVYRQALAETQIQPVEEPDLEQVRSRNPRRSSSRPSSRSVPPLPWDSTSGSTSRT